MKLLVLSILFCIVTLSIQAQWSDNNKSPQKHFLYTSGDYIVGQSNGGNLGLSYMYNNKYSISIGYAATKKVEQPIPKEFLKSGTELIPIIPDQPFQNFEELHLMVGRVFNLNKRARILLQGGPGISNYREPDFKVSGNEYSHVMQTSKKLCLVVNPKVELPLLCTLGCSVGPIFVMNNEYKYMGLGIGLMYGVLRNDKY
uniref:hypothetical protein n=1 Tax=uncultured Draconibacterium sp. TaxID=1573823 RepID=UPI0032175200